MTLYPKTMTTRAGEHQECIKYLFRPVRVRLPALKLRLFLFGITAAGFVSWDGRNSDFRKSSVVQIINAFCPFSSETIL